MSCSSCRGHATTCCSSTPALTLVKSVWEGDDAALTLSLTEAFACKKIKVTLDVSYAAAESVIVGPLIVKVNKFGQFTVALPTISDDSIVSVTVTASEAKCPCFNGAIVCTFTNPAAELPGCEFIPASLSAYAVTDDVVFCGDDGFSKGQLIGDGTPLECTDAFVFQRGDNLFAAAPPISSTAIAMNDLVLTCVGTGEAYELRPLPSITCGPVVGDVLTTTPFTVCADASGGFVETREIASSTAGIVCSGSPTDELVVVSGDTFERKRVPTAGTAFVPSEDLVVACDGSDGLLKLFNIRGSYLYARSNVEQPLASMSSGVSDSTAVVFGDIDQANDITPNGATTNFTVQRSGIYKIACVVSWEVLGMAAFISPTVPSSSTQMAWTVDIIAAGSSVARSNGRLEETLSVPPPGPAATFPIESGSPTSGQLGTTTAMAIVALTAGQEVSVDLIYEAVRAPIPGAPPLPSLVIGAMDNVTGVLAQNQFLIQQIA